MDNKKMNPASLSGKYSVLMSAYYKENPYYLECSIMSMIEQTLPPDQIILVEDGPLTDELNAVITKLTTEYPSLFTLVINEENLGLGKSLAKGLLASKNEIVARMDTDDIAELTRCQQQIDYLCEHEDVVIVGGQISEFIGDINNVIGNRVVPCEDTEIKKYIKKRCPFNHMTVMFRKSEIISVGNYIDLFWNEDYYLWIRLALAEKKMANLDSVLVNVRVDEKMYQRRGGKEYFISEKKLQRYMYCNNMISLCRCICNVSIRFIVQICLPNKMRMLLFKKVFRQRATEKKR